MSDALRWRHLMDSVKRFVDDPLRHPIKFGLITDVGLEGEVKGQIKCEIVPEGGTTDWMRYCGLGMAFGPWLSVGLPKAGAEVLMVANDTECSGYTAIGGLFNGEDVPPDFTAGQQLFKHADGNIFLMDADGKLYLGAKTSARPVVLDTWITDTFNSLVDKVNDLETKLAGHVHIGNLGVPTTTPTPPIVPSPFSHWVSGNVSVRFKGL